MPDSSRLLELFDRYLQRRCAPEEVVELIALLEQANAADALTEPMLRVWKDLKAGKAEYSVDWDRMYTRVSQVEDEISMLHHRSRSGWRRVTAAACVILLVAGVGLWGMRRGEGLRKMVVVPAMAAAVNSGGRAAEADSGGAARSMVAENSKRVVHLPDGSMVLLNKHSRLDYPRVFGDTSREVVLSGEAYFNITHLAGRPFVVHTGKLSTRVLGTTFNIRAYPEDKAISITVTSGKVQVMDQRASVGMLVADEQIRYDVPSETVVHQKVDVRPLVAWRPLEVSFDDITMEEAARRIGDSFGVTVHFVNPALKDCRVTASFYREDQLQEILTVLCAVNQMSYTIRDKDVAIDGKGCN